jgi:hypothetical protein
MNKKIIGISIKLAVSVAVMAAVATGPIWAQAIGNGAIAPIRTSGLDNQIYLGFEHTRLDYGLVNPDGTTTKLTMNGVNLQFACREWDHFFVLGSARYGAGNPLGVHNAAAGAGIGYVADWRRYEPFAQGTVGYSRLSSTSPDGIYLSTAPLYGFTTTVGAGLDVNLTDRFGVRPVYVENQFSPFGAHRTVDWSISSGLLVRFQGLRFRRGR